MNQAMALTQKQNSKPQTVQRQTDRQTDRHTHTHIGFAQASYSYYGTELLKHVFDFGEICLGLHVFVN